MRLSLPRLLGRTVTSPDIAASQPLRNGKPSASSGDPLPRDGSGNDVDADRIRRRLLALGPPVAQPAGAPGRTRQAGRKARGTTGRGSAGHASGSRNGSSPDAQVRGKDAGSGLAKRPTGTPPRHAGLPVIALRGVSRHYGGAVGTTALEDANLAVWPGEFVVILGPSGSGKSTLLGLMGGMDQPTSGDIVAAGHRISGASARGLARYRRESVSFIFQTFNLFPALSAIENVEFGASVARRKRPRAAALEMLREVGLAHRVTHFPHMLSGGEQQRVAIARALATGNPIVLADEPTGELDFRTGLQILQLLKAQAALGRTVIVVTHNREIARVADRVIELSGGRIVADRRVEGPRPALEDLHW